MTKRIKPDICFIVGIFLLGIIALPLILFVFVNYGYISPIFFQSITIPKLPFFRANEVSFLDAGGNFRNYIDMILFQSDELSHNSIPGGIYYYVSAPFLLCGFIASIFEIYHNRDNISRVVMMIQFFCSCILGMLIETNVNRINIVHIPIIYFICVGKYEVCKWLYSYKYHSFVYIAIMAIYLMQFIYFANNYMGIYNENFSQIYGEGLKEALVFAYNSSEEGDVFIRDNAFSTPGGYANVLVYLQYPTDSFVEQIVYEDNLAQFRKAKELDRIKFKDFILDEPESKGTYISISSDTAALNYFVDNKLEVEKFGYYIVGYSKN